MIEIVHHPGFDSDLVIDGRVVAKLKPHVADEVEAEIGRLKGALAGAFEMVNGLAAELRGVLAGEVR